MITIYYASWYKLPSKTCFELIKQAGFDGVSLWWGNDFGDEDFRSNPDLARQSGLQVDSVHAPYKGTNNLWLDDHSGDAFLSSLMQVVEDCANCHIPTVVVHLSGGDNPPPFNQIGLDRMKRFVDKGEKHGVNLAFENLRKVEYLKYVLDNIDSQRAGFCYDSGHHSCFAPHADLLLQYGSRLMDLHLHDNDGVEDQHLLPFDGTIDWTKTMGQIAETGYAGAIAFEVGNSGYENLPPDEFLRLVYERGVRLDALMRDYRE